LQAGTEKRRSTKPRNTVTMGVTATKDSTFEWREVGGQVSSILELKREAELEKEVFDITESIISSTRAFELEEAFTQYISLSGNSNIDNKIKKYTDVEKTLLSWCEIADGGLITIFGDFGSGKTTILKRLQYDLQKIFLQSEIQTKIPLIFLLRDRNKHSSLEKFILSTLHDNYDQVVLPKVFWDKLQHGQFVVLLDGYDEISSDVSDVEKTKIFMDLIPLLTTKSPAIMSCRPSYFITKSEISQLMLELQRRSDKLFDFSDNSIYLSKTYVKKYVSDEKKPPSSKVAVLHINLDTLSIPQMSLYLKNREKDFAFNPALNAENIQEFLFSIYDLKDLMSRPILLSLTVDTIVDGRIDIEKDTTIIGPTGLYETYTSIQLQRDVASRQHRMLSLAQRRYFAQAAALTMLDKRTLNVSYHDILEMIRDRLSDIPNLPDLPKDVQPDQIALDVLVCAFLTRQDDDSFRFVHKSFMEFFVAQFLKQGISEAFFQSNVSAALRILNRTFSNEILQFLADYSLLDRALIDHIVLISNRIDKDSKDEALSLHNACLLAIFFRERITEFKFTKFAQDRIFLKKSTWDKHQFEICKFSNSNFEKIKIKDTVFNQCTFDGASFLDCRFENSLISGNFRSSRFSNSKFDRGSISFSGDLEFLDSEISNFSSNSSGTLEASRSSFKNVVFGQRAKSRISFRDCKLFGASIRSLTPFSTLSELMDAPILELKNSDLEDSFAFLYRVDETTLQFLTSSIKSRTLRGLLFVSPDKRRSINPEYRSGNVQKISESLLLVWQDPETSLTLKSQTEILDSNIKLENESEIEAWKQFIDVIRIARHPKGRPRPKKSDHV
jgi:uncharacterized protein YjbI with pentapeptide repeats